MVDSLKKVGRRKMFRSPGDILLRFVGRLQGLVHRERAPTLAEYAMLTSFIVMGVTVLA